MKQIHLHVIDSTNTYAKEHVAQLASDEITCISAEGQTAGRGRLGRHWVSPVGVNIYATFCFQLPAHTLHLTSLALVMASSLATVLIHEGLHPKIKWPNDIQLHGKKLSGILCEIQFIQETAQIFLGIGINVNMEAEHLASIGQPATSLKIETGNVWDKNEFLQKLQNQFTIDLGKFKQHGFAPFHDLYENLLAYRGETIRCFDGKKHWEGICHSITEDGQLNLYLPNHQMHIISSGDLY